MTVMGNDRYSLTMVVSDWGMDFARQEVKE